MAVILPQFDAFGSSDRRKISLIVLPTVTQDLGLLHLELQIQSIPGQLKSPQP